MKDNKATKKDNDRFIWKPGDFEIIDDEIDDDLVVVETEEEEEFDLQQALKDAENGNR